ncbi:hypothetical protein NQD34_013190 [Periophthalmus magnuspinnatus]|nr:hypothetical protein NQD34_013190 [Periophthalmus magnuspinnatus]
MDNTRTCRVCGEGSSRKESFTNLSLDLVPGRSIEELLEHHLEETELEYRCECGGTVSSLGVKFASLPNVLILHLKRFTFSSNYQLQKVNCPIHLNRDLIVGSFQGFGLYRLISIVSHLGPTADIGHYICDVVLCCPIIG